VLRRALCFLALACCSPPKAEPPSRTTPSTSTPSAPAPSVTARPTAPAVTSSTATSSDDTPPSSPDPSISVDEAVAILFLDAPPTETTTCRGESDTPAQVRCLLKLRYPDDEATARLVVDLYDKTGTVAGIEHPHTMDGGWRGDIDLVAERPIGQHRRHLEWIAAAAADHSQFFAGLEARAGRRVPYRFKPIALRFFRSVGRTTPSAYAHDWTISYNVSGSLNHSADAVRETMFHETFHLNDDGWSQTALGAMYDGILSRCTGTNGKLKTPCLAPFAPNDTMVRGGTFYAFQPGNGVHEYSAELAIRYYREHRAVLAGKRAPKPFKCGPEENGRAWKLLVDRFFGGIDLTASCE
jgi:hypothetical protein